MTESETASKIASGSDSETGSKPGSRPEPGSRKGKSPAQAKSKSAPRQKQRTQDRRTRPQPAPQPAMDDETAAALTLFNTYLVADQERTRHERALKRAAKAKDDAATAVRALDSKAAPEQREAAEEGYREAVANWKLLRDAGSTSPTTATSGTEPEDPESASVGMESSVDQDNLAGDEAAGVTGQQ